MTPEEIDQLATRVVLGDVYVPPTPEALDASFGALLALADEECVPEGAVSMWEEISKRASLGVNGFPFFFSGHFIMEDEWEPLVNKINEKLQALGVQA